MMKFKIFTAFLVIVLFGSCESNSENNEKQNINQITNKSIALDYFYTAYKAENFDALTVMLPKNEKEKEAFIEMLKKINNQIGKLNSFEQIGIGNKKGNSQTLYIFNMLETHSKQQAYAKLTIMKENGKFTINSYQHYKDKESLFAE